MKAWAVAVTAMTPHGQSLLAIFTLAATKGEAVAQGVRAIFDTHDPNCSVTITCTQATEVASDAVKAAAEQLTPTEA